jgi:hypothetical protein
MKPWLASRELFPGSEVLSRRAFKNAAVWDNCALFTVIGAGFGLSQNSRAHSRRIECLLPQSCPA